MSGSFSEDSEPEYDYFTSEFGTSSQNFASSPGAVNSNYVSSDVRKFVKIELLGHQSFDQPNVLERLGVRAVNDSLVERCFQALLSNTDFQTQKATLQGLVRTAEAATSKRATTANIQDEGKGKRRENDMRKPLYKILEEIRKFGGNAKYQREFLSFKNVTLKGEGDTFSFPLLAPDFTICDLSGERNTDFKPRPGTKNIWRLRSAFIELKPSSKQGPVTSSISTVTDIVAQAADYARLHMSSRPFQLYSIGLLIFGSKFRVAIIDRDGVEFSAVADMWEDEGFKLFIRVIRRLCCEMSPYELGMDPNVKLLGFDDPVSRACREYSQVNIDISVSHLSYQEEVEVISAYPTYAINVRDIEYFTVGRPIWTSLSLMGRGTNIWKVTTHAQSLHTIAGSLFIMKSAWRKSGRTGESMYHEHIKIIKERYKKMVQSQNSQENRGSSRGLVEYSDGMDVLLPDDRILSSANLRNVSGNQVDDTTILHRILFKTIGRPIWEFDNFLEFFLGIRDALAGHEFLANEGILHRDISAGNMLLSLKSSSKTPGDQRGFLTDFEFARFEKSIEVRETIEYPSMKNPNNSKLLPPGTRTHTTFKTTDRGAPMTGTVQFMAYELVLAMSNNKNVKHTVHHDVESFIWVIAYAVLRRVGYVKRPLQDIDIANAEIIEGAQGSLKRLFGHVNLDNIFAVRHTFDPPSVLFKPFHSSLPSPLIDFFEKLYVYVNSEVRINSRTTDHPFGRATHAGLSPLLDEVIHALSELPQYRAIS